jgi:hypothetical protein
MKNIFIAATLILFTNSSFAGILGPSSFEECMNDGKVGRNRSELQIHENSCRKKFPKLSNLKKGKSTKITCVFDDMVGGLQFEFNLNKKIGTGGGKNQYALKIISVTDEFIDFSVVGEKDEGRLNLLTGALFFKYVDKKGQSSNHSSLCNEIR